MAHLHSPRDVEDAAGIHLRTVCNECGATLEDEPTEDAAVAAEEVAPKKKTKRGAAKPQG